MSKTVNHVSLLTSRVLRVDAFFPCVTPALNRILQWHAHLAKRWFRGADGRPGPGGQCARLLPGGIERGEARAAADVCPISRLHCVLVLCYFGTILPVFYIV